MSPLQRQPSAVSAQAAGRGACWCRLAKTVLGVGCLAALLLLALLAVAYFLPVPVLVVPAAAAATAVVYVTDRSRKAETGSEAPRPWVRPGGPRSSPAAAAPDRHRLMPAWPTGRRRRAAMTTRPHEGPLARSSGAPRWGRTAPAQPATIGGGTGRG